MILTVTLNPLLERRFLYDTIKIDSPNRGGVEQLKAGGKGINVSRQLNLLGIDNLALTFLGGMNGKVLRNVLTEEGIKISVIKTKSDTREAAIILDNSTKTITSYFSENSSISLEEIEEFKRKLEKMIRNCEMVVFSGSSPSIEANSIFPFGIKLANEYGKFSILDTYGEHLNASLEAVPTIIHNNVNEIESSLNCSLSNEKEKMEFLSGLYNKGIKQVYLTDGPNPFYISNFDFHYKVEIPKIETLDSTGSGDCFTAGIIYGLHKNLTFEENVTVASSLGIVNASRFDISKVNIQEIDKYKKLIKLYAVGKKMKTLDVTHR